MPPPAPAAIRRPDTDKLVRADFDSQMIELHALNWLPELDEQLGARLQVDRIVPAKVNQSTAAP